VTKVKGKNIYIKKIFEKMNKIVKKMSKVVKKVVKKLLLLGNFVNFCIRTGKCLIVVKKLAKS
jgi:hypothetical protein